MNKFISLPFYTSILTNLENFKKIIKTDFLFLINEGVGFSSLLLLIVAKIFKRINTSMFVMGLYSKNQKFKTLKFAHLFFIKLLIENINNVLFLGDSELRKASITHKKYIDRFKFLPFCVDMNFGQQKKKTYKK